MFRYTPKSKNEFVLIWMLVHSKTARISTGSDYSGGSIFRNFSKIPAAKGNSSLWRRMYAYLYSGAYMFKPSKFMNVMPN